MFLLHWPPCVFRYCYSIWLESQISISLYPCCCHIKRYPILSWLFKWYPQYLDRNTDDESTMAPVVKDLQDEDQGTNIETCCSTVQRSRHLQVLFLVQTVINRCSNLVPAPPMPWSKRGMLQFINWKHTKKSQCWSRKHCLCHQSMCTCQPSSMAKTFLPWSHAAEFHPWYIPWECTNSWTFRT